MKTSFQRLGFAVMLLLLPFFLRAQSNQYLHFDKVDDYVLLQGGSQYIAGSQAFSMAGWFYTDALAYGQGLMGFRSASQGFYLIILNNGEIECRLISSAGFHEYKAPANSIVPQMWQHIAFVYDGSSITLYMNGVVKGSTAASGTITASTIAFAIGKSMLASENFVYGGRIDEINVWNKSLTQAEIQDMMANELTGTETGLQLYYKFDQGVPGGDNTSITSLHCEIDSPARDADLHNFALTGNTSNFGGTLNPGFQAISFQQIPGKLISDPPFTISATASSGLPVSFEIVSGPATISGDTVTLTGVSGLVTVKATQNGNGVYSPAAPVINTFTVYDPATHVPVIDPRHPLAGDVRMPSLKALPLAAIATISVPELFQVQSVQFGINGDIIPAVDHGNSHYTGWWTPPAYGTYTLTISATNNFGHDGTQTVGITIIPDTVDTEVTACQGIWLNSDVGSLVVEASLPSYVGAYDLITGKLEVTCPSGGCGEWDRVASVEVKGHDGKWIEIIRYITPYGVPCNHQANMTDYMSLLAGKVSFRLNCATYDNGYLYQLKFQYGAGIPAHPYSKVHEIWNETFPFGDYANLQPVPPVTFSFPANTLASTLKLVSTGHGWGDLNTGNAAEFYNATHHLWINNQETFQQHNWQACNPNPDGCQPQNGTWFYARAGWCPGSIAPWFNYEMNPFISTEDIEIKYVFYPDYVDLCHPNHPDCETGITCDDCEDGFNPMLDVACNLVVFADQPVVEGIDRISDDLSASVRVYPNPSTGQVNISTNLPESFRSSIIVVYKPDGNSVKQIRWNGENAEYDLNALPKGVYFLRIGSGKGTANKKIILM